MMKKLIASTATAGILALFAHAALADEYCWKVEDANPQGSGLLRLSAMDFGAGNIFAAGKMVVSLQEIPGVRPAITIEQYLSGAAVAVSGAIEVSLTGSDIQRTNTNPNDKVWAVSYHVMLDSGLNGKLKGTMVHDDGAELIEEYREADMTFTQCPLL